jgi:hypothetical protein
MTLTSGRSRAALLIALSLALAACQSDRPPVTSLPSATPAPSPSPSAEPVVLLTVETRGGECVNGPCGSLIAIRSDGSVHQVRPTTADLGTIPSAALDALTVEIGRANFPLIESRPFTDTCPTAYDGQETVYTFQLPTGREEIATCKVAIDPNHPLFLAVAAAMRTINSEGS